MIITVILPADKEVIVHTFVKNFTTFECPEGEIEVSDGYHTMSELYEHRMALFAALCNVYSGGYKSVGIISWKSKRHSDGSIPFNDSTYFIAGIQTPHGQVSYHMKIDPWWDRFKIPELEKAPKYDGHKSHDVIERLLEL